jgi:hypothetical protein
MYFLQADIADYDHSVHLFYMVVEEMEVVVVIDMVYRLQLVYMVVADSQKIRQDMVHSFQ